MKKTLYLFAFILMFVGVYDVKASTYYTNTKGVDFTKEEYDFISEMYYDGYQEYVTKVDLDKIVNLDLIGKPVSKNITTEGGLNPRSTSVYYAGRTLTIASTCSSECLVTLKAQWNGTPTIKSWDVIGFRFLNLTVNSINSAFISGTGYSDAYLPGGSEFKQLTNGFGYSVKLGNANNLKITTSMYTEPGGTAYGSYQHATENVSLATSKSYTIGVGGYGYVFHFNGNAFGKYDAAPGVYKGIS